MDDAPPPAIPGYEIISLLGRGATGAVYKARQVGVGRRVALKVIGDTLSSQAEFVARFLREARTIASLSHGNIVAAYDAGRVGEACYLAMELIEGESCQARLARLFRFKERAALKISIQVAHALQHAHRHGIVHRDVKPANILIADREVAKLCDFGLARPTASGNTVTDGGLCLGSPWYMSPEQGGDMDIRSDIYSLGATLYHLVTGVPPFEGSSMMAILMKHVMEPVPPPRRLRPDLTKATEAIILRAMAKQPEDRYDEPVLLARALEEALAGASRPRAHAREELPAKPKEAKARPMAPVAPPAMAPPPQRRPRGRAYVVAASIAVALLAVVVAATWPGRDAVTRAAPVAVAEPPDRAMVRLQEIEASAAGWQSQPERVPEIADRFRRLLAEEALASSPSAGAAKERMEAFLREVNAEADRRLGPLLELCDVAEQGARFVEVKREVERYLKNFDGTGACVRAVSRLKQLDQRERQHAEEARDRILLLIEQGDHAAARAALEEARDSCTFSTLVATQGFHAAASRVPDEPDAETAPGTPPGDKDGHAER